MNRVGMRIFFDLAAIILNSVMGSQTNIALMFAMAFGFQAGIIHGE
jgi:hypothetical protein